MQTRKYTFIYILMLVAIGLMATATAQAEWPDYGSNCNTAFLVDAPSSNWGYLYKNDKDYFKIVVGSPGTLTVFTTGSTDTFGNLYNSNCKSIAQNDDLNWPSNTNFQIVKTVAAGTYYVRVKGYDKRVRGSYQFKVLFDGQQNHTVTATATSGGSISPSGAQSIGHNGSITFNIEPDSCYVISDLLVDGSSVGAKNYYNFPSVTKDRTIHAVFTQEGPFAIEASAETGGTISPSGTVLATCGADQTFTITAGDHFEILDVVVDDTSRGAVEEFTLTGVGETHTIVAKFKEDTNYTITTIAGDNGNITPEGPVSVYKDEDQTFTFTPLAGYSVEEVWVDGDAQGAMNSYTFTKVKEDHTIEVHFKADEVGGSTGCLDISDTPLDARFRSAPPLIMFAIDDSGSMDWEVMTSEAHSRFGPDGIAYVFDDPGDNFYNAGYGYSYGKILSGDQRKDWKAQWSGYNKMYYNPDVEYTPWPNLDPASTKTPLSHPKVEGVFLTLADTYLEMTDADATIIDDGDTGFSTSGTWYTNSYYSYAINSDYRYSSMAAEEKTATWSPNLSMGLYKVYVRWTNTYNNPTKVTYEVNGSNWGSGDEYEVDQTQGALEWHYLGQKFFSSGGYVKMTLDSTLAQSKYASVDAVKLVPVDWGAIEISNAHYYTFHDVDANGELDSGEQVYLVNFVDSNNNGQLDKREWYEVNDDGDDHIQKSELSPISENGVPEAVRPRSISDDLQNFANWYSYFRRRELSATAAVASVIDQAERMLIGIHSINGLLNEPVHKISVDGVDERDALLEKLYASGVSPSGTPLRKGLERVGMYFDKTDSTTDTSGIHTLPSPYATAADGGACQQAFTILMTDGYYNGTDPTIGNTDGGDGAPYADTFSNTLADVAMYYYKKDLVHDDDLKDLVPTNDRDQASHQHMVTYGVGFGVSGTLDPANYDIEGGVYPTWPDPDPSADPVTGEYPEDMDQRKIDDLWHAAVNGRGRFLTSNDAVELLNDLLMVFKDIEHYAGSASSVSVNGDELYTEMSDRLMLFQAKYYSENWHGDVLAYKVDKASGAIQEPAIWSAAKQLSLKSADQRLIATSYIDHRGRFKQASFLWNDLKNKPDMWKKLDADKDTAEKILNYLRGDDADEVDSGGTFRNRTWRINDPYHPLNGEAIASSKLGDVVHSSPVYKNGALYTGGNDGMLHAFNATTGEELFGYVPYLVFDNLKDLADPDYSHKYYVDLTPSVADVSLSTGVSVMLVGGLGKGGKGYYAVDISAVNPETGSVPSNHNKVKKMVMWEFPNGDTRAEDIVDMGYSYSKATVAKSHDVSKAEYMVIFGNGYNSDSETAALFIIDPRDGALIRKIDTGVTGCNGLSTPMAVDVDFDGKVDYVYAGDLRGNMWKFDLTSTNSANWDVAFAESSVPMPLFTATGGNTQPITTRPDVMKHCTEDGYLVFFGTGKYLEETDLKSTDQQTVYAIWDYGDDDDDKEFVGQWDSGNSRMTNTYLDSAVNMLAQGAPEYIVNGDLIRVTTANNPDWTPTTEDGGGQCGANNGNTMCDKDSSTGNADPTVHVAWHLDLPTSGERIVSDLLVRDGNLVVVSYIPEGTMCGTGGSSWLMEFNACTGKNPSYPLFDVDDDGDVDDDDKVKITTGGVEKLVSHNGINFDGRLQTPAFVIFGNNTEVLYMSSSKGKIETKRQKSARLGVVYWRIFRP